MTPYGTTDLIRPAATTAWMTRTVQGIAAVLFILGIVVILGWVGHVAALIQIVPTWAPMQVNTALGMVLCGVGLLGLSLERRSLTIVGGGYAILMGALTLSEYVGHVNIGIDEWLMRADSIMAHVSSPGRMAPNTALCFTLTGIAMLLCSAGHKRSIWIATSALGIIVSTIGLAAILGYLFRIPVAYGWWDLTQMALHTALGMVLLGCGLCLSAQRVLRALGQEPQRTQSSGYGLLLAFVALGVTLVLTLTAWQYTLSQLNQGLNGRFHRQVSRIVEAVDERMAEYLNQLEGFVGLFAASKSVERDEFHAFFAQRRLSETSPGMLAVAFIEHVPADALGAFLERARTDRSMLADGYPALTVTPAGNRPEYFIANYVEPYQGNEAGHGYDLGSDPDRLDALTQARDTGECALTGLLTFVIPPHPRGILALLPIYRNGAPRTTLDERRAALVGFVSAGVASQPFFTSLLVKETVDPQVDVEVFDGPVLDEDHLLFDSDGILRVHEGHRQARFQTTRTLFIGGRTWTLCLTALPGFGWDPVREYLPCAVLVVGVILSLLLFGVLSSLAITNEQATTLAQRMTSNLRESERRYATLIDNAPDPIITLSLLGQLQSMNPAAEAVSGYRAEELVGKHFVQTGVVQTASIPAAVREFGFAVTGAKRPPFELEIVHKNGARLMMEANPCPVKIDGRVTAIQVIFRDITERKRIDGERLLQSQELGQRNRELLHQQRMMQSLLEDMENTKRHLQEEIVERERLTAQREEQARALATTNQELLQQQKVMQSLLEDVQRSKELVEDQGKQLETANRRLKELAALKDEFVAKVSHELRTPLTAIKEGVSLIIDNALGETTAEQQDFLKTMDADIDRLTELINNMLDISKIEAGRMRLGRARTALLELLATMKRSHEPLLGHRTVRIESQDASPEVFIDPNRMLQVFNNLLSNAIKFTADDGTITFQITQHNGTVDVAVRDNGPGIAHDELPKLFQKFSQVGQQGVGRPRGTGLGLALCKELTELHGGHIDVTSTVGRGTVFTVSLPVYSELRALAISVRDLLDHAPAEEACSMGLIAIHAESVLRACGDHAARRQQLERILEDVRHHVHRGDNVLALDPAWVIVLALTDAKGAQAMMKRLRDSIRHGAQCAFSAAMYPQEGVEAEALLRAAQLKRTQETAGDSTAARVTGTQERTAS